MNFFGERCQYGNNLNVQYTRKYRIYIVINKHIARCIPIFKTFSPKYQVSQISVMIHPNVCPKSFALPVVQT